MNQNTSHQAHQTHLLGAVADGHLDHVNHYLELGASPNARLPGGNSAIAIAAASGFIEIVRALIRAGANVNQRVKTAQETLRVPIHCAIMAGHLDIVHLLLDNGADTRVMEEKNKTAAHLFLDTGRLDLHKPADRFNVSYDVAMEVFKRIATRETVNLPDEHGRSVLHCAMSRKIHPAALDLLLQRGGNPELMTKFGTRALHRHWNADNAWMLAKLAEHGANFDSRDMSGAGILHTASDFNVAQEMLRLGAKLDCIDNQGRNTLCLLIDESGPNALCLSLVDAGADVTQKDYCGESAQSRLATRDDDQAKVLLAHILARQARNAMALGARASGPAPKS